MSLNKSIILINILSYSVFGKSVEVLYPNNISLQRAYREEVETNQINNMNINLLCGYEPTSKDERNLMVGTACKYVIDVLRKNKEYENLYVFYSLYDTLERDICENREVILMDTDLTLKLSGSDKILQRMVKCYRRPAMYNIKDSVIFKQSFEIFIYPSSLSSPDWLVFEFDRSTQVTLLKTWIRINDFGINYIPIQLTFLPVPAFISREKRIFSYLYPFRNIWQEAVLDTYKTHVLDVVDDFYFGQICRAIVGIDNFSRMENIPKPTSKSMLLPLYQPKTNEVHTLDGLMWECDGFVDENGWLLFAGPVNYTIIVVKIFHNRYEIVKIVLNIYTEYLYYIF